MEIEVDGERFSVVERSPGTYDITWLSGPNDGYGFTSGGGQMNERQLEESIRIFLAQVDPSTGYIE